MMSFLFLLCMVPVASRSSGRREGIPLPGYGARLRSKRACMMQHSLTGRWLDWKGVETAGGSDARVKDGEVDATHEERCHDKV